MIRLSRSRESAIPIPIPQPSLPARGVGSEARPETGPQAGSEAEPAAVRSACCAEHCAPDTSHVQGVLDILVVAPYLSIFWSAGWTRRMKVARAACALHVRHMRARCAIAGGTDERCDALCALRRDVVHRRLSEACCLYACFRVRVMYGVWPQRVHEHILSSQTCAHQGLAHRADCCFLPFLAKWARAVLPT